MLLTTFRISLVSRAEGRLEAHIDNPIQRRWLTLVAFARITFLSTNRALPNESSESSGTDPKSLVHWLNLMRVWPVNASDHYLTPFLYFFFVRENFDYLSSTALQALTLSNCDLYTRRGKPHSWTHSVLACRHIIEVSTRILSRLLFC